MKIPEEQMKTNHGSIDRNGDELLSKAFEELINKMFTKEELQVMEAEHKKWLDERKSQEDENQTT